MDQTSVIAGSLILAYIVFITVRGELTGYLQDLGIVSGETAPTAQPYTTSSQTVTQGPQIIQSGGGSSGGGGGSTGGGSGGGGTVGGPSTPTTPINPNGQPPNTVPNATSVVCPTGYTADSTGNCVKSSVSGYGGGACNGFIDPNTGVCVENPNETNPPDNTTPPDSGGGGYIPIQQLPGTPPPNTVPLPPFPGGGNTGGGDTSGGGDGSSGDTSDAYTYTG